MQFGSLSPSSAIRTTLRDFFVMGVAVALLTLLGCRKDVAEEASDSDANGYLCTKCGAKFYTDRSVFLSSACPKCKAEGLAEVVGFFCEKDQLMILAARGRDRGEAARCEKCGATISGMRLPREKDLKTWGAGKVPKS